MRSHTHPNNSSVMTSGSTKVNNAVTRKTESCIRNGIAARDDAVSLWSYIPDKTATTHVPHVPSPPQFPVWNGESNLDVRSSYILMFWLFNAVRRLAPIPERTVKLPALSPDESVKNQIIEVSEHKINGNSLRMMSEKTSSKILFWLNLSLFQFNTLYFI